MSDILAEYNPFWFGINLKLDILDKFEDPKEVLWLYLETFGKVVEKKHMDFIHSQPTEELKYLAINLFSVISHEHRHWMDICSTPFGTYINLQTFSFYLNSFAASGEFNDLKTITCPLNRNKNSGLDHIAAVVKKNYELIDKIETRVSQSALIGGKKISAVHILEGLAILQQEAFIKHFFDDYCLDIFIRNSKKTEAYGFLLTYLRTSTIFDDKAIFKLLYYSLFGCSGALQDTGIDVSPPVLLNKFIQQIKDKEEIVTSCDKVLIEYQGYPSYAAMYFSREKAVQHISKAKEQLTSGGINDDDINILISSMEFIVQNGSEIFRFIEDDKEVEHQHLLIGYVKASWPLVFYQSLGLVISDNFPNLTDRFDVYLSSVFDNAKRPEIIASIPFQLMSVMDSILSQIPEDYDGTFVVMKLFSFSTVDDESSDDKESGKIPLHFNLKKIFRKILYFDILFRGGVSLEQYNLSGFQKTYLDDFGQEIIINKLG